MVYIPPFNDNIESKIQNLEINSKKQIVGKDDRVVYGYVDEFKDLELYSKKSGKTEYVKVVTVESMTLANGIVTVKFNTGKKDLVFSKGKPIKTVQEIPKAEPNTDDLEQEIIEDNEPDTENFENGSNPETADFENLPKEILDFQSKINDKLIVEKDDFGQYQLRDLDKNDYAMIQRDLKTICFWDRGNNPKYELRPSLHRIVKIDLLENQTIQVDFNDGTQAIYNPQVKPKESKRKEILTDDTPKDEFIISDDPNLPRYDGTYSSVEECITYLYGSEKLNKCLYTNVLDERLYFDTSLIGENPPRIEPYNANRELTIVIQQLEQKYVYFEKGQVKRPKFSKTTVDDILVKFAMGNRRNPFLEEIEKIEYKGLLHPKSFLRDIGCSTRLPEIGDSNESELYLANVGCAIFLAVIERQKHLENNRPIRFVPIFIGEQGIGKSTFCVKMGLDQKGILHKESTVSIDDKKAYYEEINGCVISEIAEGTQFILGKQDSYKAYFDDNFKHYRKPYDREPVNLEKHWIEIITTNNNEILTDVTGNVRYFPVFMDGIEKPIIPIQEYSIDDMLQLYACALEMYERGERWHTYIENPEMKAISEKVRESVTKDVIGLTEIGQLAESKAEIGSILSRAEIEYYLASEPNYYDNQIIKNAINLFAKSCNKYGFRKLANPRDVKLPNGFWKKSRGFQRVALSKNST